MAATNRQMVIFDVETTGTDKRRDQVIELCVQFGLDDNPADPADPAHRVWRIRPDVEISPGAQAVHGIAMADLMDCPRFVDVADEIRAVFDAAETLVGYNVAFDIDFLQAEFARAKQPLIDIQDKQVVDAFRLWQQCEPRSLQDAHRRFVGTEFQQAHSAAADVAATGRVLRGMMEAFGLGDKEMDELAVVCEPERNNWVGSSRHICWSEDGEPTINFGKHKGTTLAKLAEFEGGGYLKWIVGKDFPRHVGEVCAKALEHEPEDFLLWVQHAYRWQAPAAAAQVVLTGPTAAEAALRN